MDSAVPVDNSRMYVESLRSCGVSVEYLELTEGNHGLGCGKGPLWKIWQKACIKWLAGIFPELKIGD